MRSRAIRMLERIPASVVLLSVCIIAYGPLIPFLGFYWDDLPNMWVYHMFGAQGYITYAANHRPFSAWVFILTTPLLGESPLGYHILALLLRWAGAVAVWWTLKQLWPSAEKERLWVGLLFAVYPGFRELPIATVFNVHLVCMLLMFFSFGGMLWALRHPRWFWLATTLSVGASAVGIFTMEYFITLELLRPLLLWMVLREKSPPSVPLYLKVFICSLPYLMVLALYGIWRIFIFKFPYYVPVLIETNLSFIDRITTLLPQLANSILRAGILAWGNPFSTGGFDLMGTAMMLLFWTTVVIGTGFTFLLTFQRRAGQSDNLPPSAFKPASWSIQAILLGVISLFLAGWPIWIAGLEVDLDALGSRFTLPFIFGSVLLLTGLIALVPIKNSVKYALVSLLVGFCAAWHLKTTNVFRYEWSVFKGLFWQMTWRAPALKPGTALLANDIPLRYYSDNSLTAMLNWTYSPDSKSLDMPYLLDYISVRLGAGLPDLEPGLPVTQDYSTLSFSGSTDETIAIFAVPPSCLRFLDRRLDDNYQRLPLLSGKASNISNLDQIQFDRQATPPVTVFGDEPSPGWCYYYEKADLARQAKDWDAVVQYGDIAFSLGDNPNEATERLPFIEGYAHLENWNRALELSRDTYQHGKSGVTTMLCNTWVRISKTTPDSPERAQVFQIIRSEFNCNIQ